jgi:hypothetical protein
MPRPDPQDWVDHDAFYKKNDPRSGNDDPGEQPGSDAADADGPTPPNEDNMDWERSPRALHPWSNVQNNPKPNPQVQPPQG